eukprot:1155540-Pelagomonas_calceolata.AAC.1
MYAIESTTMVILHPKRKGGKLFACHFLGRKGEGYIAVPACIEDEFKAHPKPGFKLFLIQVRPRHTNLGDKSTGPSKQASARLFKEKEHMREHPEKDTFIVAASESLP